MEQVYTGCRSCFKMCKPCTLKCKCKLRCNNPHNNVGKCPRCTTPTTAEDHDSSDNESDQEDNQIEDLDNTTLPIVPSTNADEFDTDSDSDEDEPQST